MLPEPFFVSTFVYIDFELVELFSTPLSIVQLKIIDILTASIVGRPRHHGYGFPNSPTFFLLLFLFFCLDAPRSRDIPTKNATSHQTFLIRGWDNY